MLHCKAVAPRFAVSAKTVREIWSGRSWTRVTRPEWSAAEIAARLGCWPDSDDGPEAPIATPMPGLGSYGNLSNWHGLSAQGGNPHGMGVTAHMLQQARNMVPGMPGAPSYDFPVPRPSSISRSCWLFLRAAWRHAPPLSTLRSAAVDPPDMFMRLSPPSSPRVPSHAPPSSPARLPTCSSPRR